MRRNRMTVVASALLLAAVVIITVVIITLGLNQVEQAEDLSNAVSMEMIDLTQKIRNSDVTACDNCNFTGAEVQNFYMKYLGHSAATTGEFKVNITNPDGVCRTYSDGAGYDKITSASYADYVKPTAYYTCKVVINDNQVITEVAFTAIP